jgi:hypothetical protein
LFSDYTVFWPKPKMTGPMFCTKWSVSVTPCWIIVRSRRRGCGDVLETRSVFPISMPRLLWHDSLRCWRPVAQRRVRPLRVVFHPPPFRQNLCLLQRVKDLAIQEFVAQLSVETLTVSVLPRTPLLDV